MVNKKMETILERNKKYLLRKQKELGLTDSDMTDWIMGKRDFTEKDKTRKLKLIRDEYKKEFWESC